MSHMRKQSGWDMHKNCIYIVLLVTLIIIGAGLFLSPVYNLVKEPVEQHKKKVTVGLAMQPSSALFNVALNKGFFSDCGLDVQVLEFPSGKRALNEGLITGKVNIITTADMPVVTAYFKGYKLKIIASIFSADNVNRIIARRDAGIEKPADLAGKKIATQKASAVHYFLHLFLLENGLTEKDLNISFMKAEDLPQALADGSIDAFSMREPYITTARDLLNDNVVIFSEPGVYEQREIVLANQDFVEENPETINKLLKAFILAEEFTRDHPAGAMQILADRLNIEVASIRNIWPEVKIRTSLDQSMILAMEDISRWAISTRLTEQTKVPNYLDAIYTKGLKEINPESVTIIHLQPESKIVH